jgi:hypothetical protein
MDVCRTASEDITTMSDHRKTSNDVHQWQRWDDELVEEFGCWVGRLAKAFAILAIAICTGVMLQLL